MKHKLLLFLLLFTLIGTAAKAQMGLGQEKKDSSFRAPVKVQDNPIAAMLDSLANLQFFDKTNKLYDQNYSNIHNFAKDFVPFYSDEVYAERFAQLGKTSPIPLVYNRQVKDMIELYAVKKRGLTERMLGMAQLYFPMIEELLDRYGIPLEMKYLAIVESALNPIARSPVGAGGLWQFMYGTGKQYSLDVNSYVDDRSDPYKSTIAACKHLNDLYKVHKNWLLVLAAYNSGTGNVTKAIRRSGGKTDFWDISPYLPKETRGYVPAFIAVTYVMNHASDHNLYPRMPIFKYHEIDTVLVKDFLTFDALSERLNIPKEELLFLNPAYRKGVIPSTSDKSYFLRLPKRAVADFVNNESSLYAYSLQKQQINKENVLADLSHSQESFLHYVKSNETLTSIATLYGVNVTDLKQWNHITRRSVHKGQRLIINRTTGGTEENLAANKPAQHVSDSQNVVNKTPVTKTVVNKVESQPLAQAMHTAVAPAKNDLAENATKLKHHIVKKGQKLSQIANMYGVTIAQIKTWNNLKGNGLLAGQRLRIHVPVNEEPMLADLKSSANSKAEKSSEPKSVAEKTKAGKKGKESYATNNDVEYHKVKAGESLAKLSKKYNVSVDQIKEWNNLDKKGTILPGQKLIVNQTEAAQKEPALASNDRGSRNNKETREPAPTKTYKVKKGDTYSSLATKFSISVEDLKALNSKAGNKLKAGEKIIVSGPEPAAENDNLASKGNSQENKKQQGKQKCINYKVQPGDTLWRIANMHKGISIDEIKKWNNLKSEEVVPGQVIKIVVPS